MSRRKQSRPRAVKAVGESGIFKICPSKEKTDDGDDDDDDDDNTLLEESLIVALSPTIENDTDNGSHKKQNKDVIHSSDAVLEVNGSDQCLSYAVSSDLPPNFLLPSPTSAFSVPVASKSTPSSSTSAQEMARCKSSPKNRSWARQKRSHSDLKTESCSLSSSQLQNGTVPQALEEGKDYFIDNDGTLTIKNGVCPRSLALTLFADVSASRSKYEKLLGENLDTFLLNLKHIVDGHVCPNENPSKLLDAQNLLETYGCKSSSKYALLQKRSPGLSKECGGDSWGENAYSDRKIAGVLHDVSETALPENFLHSPSYNVPVPQFSSSHKEKNLSSLLSTPPSYVMTNHNSTSNIERNVHKDGASDSASTGGSSRVPSPSPSVSSVTSGLGLSDLSKQISNTKRGCKILPVASSNGQTRYQCPVCSLEVSSDHELTVHIRSHNQSGQQTMPNTCTICGKTLSSQSSLDRHMLVHSGERPFKCKICDMSFTTNGNMHRHSRIHEKNGITLAKSSGRKQIEAKSQLKEDLTFQDHKSAANTTSGRSHNEVPFQELGSDKMDITSGSGKVDLASSQYHFGQSKFMQQYYRFMSFPFSSSHHPAFPFAQLMQDPTRMAIPFLQIDPLTSMSFAEQARFTRPQSSFVREASPDLRAQQKYNCNVCDAVFTNQFSLESHLESHVIVDEKLEAESGSACKTCKKVAKSEESLLLHSLMHHKVNEIPEDRSSPSSTSASTNSSIDKHSNMGFQNLGFANFTTKKFPLIAKAYCESNPIIKGIRFPLFKCQECGQEFPVEGARDLHEASHLPEEYTVCPKCDCHFSESSRLQVHMQKHVSDKKFEESDGVITQELPGSMAQNYFLAQFGLTAKDSYDLEIVKEPYDSDDDWKEESQISDESVLKAENLEEDMANNDNINSAELQRIKPVSSKMPARSNILPHQSTSLQLISEKAVETSQSLRKSRIPTEVEGDQLLMCPASRSPSRGSETSPESHDNSAAFESSMPPMFPCKFCDAVMSSPRDLKYHQRKHIRPPQFQCRVCSYTSSDKSTLLRHMRTHSGERPYKCAVCEYSFTTKANCERHLRQKHGVEKEQMADKLACNKYIIANKGNHSLDAAIENSISSEKGCLCKACGIDFFTWKGLRQHLHVSSNCHIGYICKKCKTNFPSHSSIMKHLNKVHPDISAQRLKNLIISVENLSTSSLAVTTTPPPAHCKPTVSPSANSKSLLVEQIIMKEEELPVFVKDTKTVDSVILPKGAENDSDVRVHFSGLNNKTQQQSLPDHAFYRSWSEDEPSLDEVPIDLSLSRSHLSPAPQTQRPSFSDKTLNDSAQQSEEMPKHHNIVKDDSGMKWTSSTENVDLLRKSDGNNNQLTPFTTSSSGVNSNLLQLSPLESASLSSRGRNSDVIGSVSLLNTAKHPAFPQFLPLMKTPGLLQSAPGSQALNFSRHPALPPVVQSLAFVPGLHPSFLSLSDQLASRASLSSQAENSPAKSDVEKKNDSKPIKTKTDIGNSVCLKAQKDFFKIQEKVTDANTSLSDMERNAALTSKFSSSESDSSCELASVNKILDATGAQNFQDFLAVAELEDEQDNKSESVTSGEDSDLSMETMYSHSQSLTSEAFQTSWQNRSVSEEDKNEGLNKHTVNTAFSENNLSGRSQEKICKQMNFTDPNNMSEQAIAELIEKVSQENVGSPAKKKRNSYADSPHKFSCPYCPRCFPWLSSLNRHLLTHTGQKPFKCPRCPVTFSTKSNRERHLIRKHNVNMLDPASRSTMDRPYKCHLCVFSSFSARSNLMKHYKDRHNGVSPPPHCLEGGDKSCSDDGEDCTVNDPDPSYEDEEEYNTLAEMHSHFTDKEIMLQNYVQDSDSNHSSSNNSPFRDPHKKRNAIFNLSTSEEDPVTSKYHSNNVSGTSSQPTTASVGTISCNKAVLVPAKSSNLTSRPGIDDTVLTDKMKSFLDKSVRQALEDSHRKAIEEGSKFVITPAIERHLRHLPKSTNADATCSGNPNMQCAKCEEEFSSHQLLCEHLKDYGCDLPFKCYLCDNIFSSRVKCLQHMSQQHPSEWATLKEKGEIGNIQVFATRLDKMIDKHHKKDMEKLSAVTDKNLLNDAQRMEDTDLEKAVQNGKDSHHLTDVEGTSKVTENGDYWQKRVYCAVCPGRFQSLQELARHMHHHTGQKSALSGPSKDVASAPEKAIIIAVNGGRHVNNDQHNNSSSGSGCAQDNAEETQDEDMLHNLLGVESSTIDQIFDAKDSAASLLGV